MFNIGLGILGFVATLDIWVHVKTEYQNLATVLYLYVAYRGKVLLCVDVTHGMESHRTWVKLIVLNRVISDPFGNTKIAVTA